MRPQSETRVLAILVTIVAVMVSYAAFAQATVLSPVTVTGYNYDIIYGPAGGQGGGYADGVDSWDQDTWFAAGTADTGGTVRNNGLPVGNFASAADATHTYSLAAAGGDAESKNSLGLENGATGTLTLATPGKYSTIGVLAASTNGGENGLSLVLNYADATHSSGLTYNAPDWGNLSASNAAFRVERHHNNTTSTPLDGFTYDGTHLNRFALYETVVSADPGKVLESVTFTGTTVYSAEDGYARTQIMAVGGYAIPEPSAIALLATGIIGLLAYAWRKRR
jgi:hypothetical protein